MNAAIWPKITQKDHQQVGWGGKIFDSHQKWRRAAIFTRETRLLATEKCKRCPFTRPSKMLVFHFSSSTPLGHDAFMQCPIMFRRRGNGHFCNYDDGTETTKTTVFTMITDRREMSSWPLKKAKSHYMVK